MELAPARTADSVLSPRAREQAAAIGARFAAARPFPHAVVDGFFADDFAEQLLATFPPFAQGDARNEAGQLGGKAVVERIRGLGPAWARLDDQVRSRAFLDVISAMTGIPDLLYDPAYVGGGTHENRHGQDLDPHVDFNFHPFERWHRRLNLIVYLNHEWQDDWGGSLELHSDPRAKDDQVTLVTPLFNRAVIFATSEVSWHGFSRITLPPDRRHLSRRSVALYFYTVDRPAAETGPPHSTIYVDRPLPERFRAGRVLDAADVAELELLLRRRDQHNQRLYGELTAMRQRFDAVRGALEGGLFGRLRFFANGLLRRLRR
jgi:Rps23 Pro-64 3,4-dihydroxylase Tpa1-like proline 4-hydroxylase